MDVTERMRISQRVERLRNNVDGFLIRQPTALRIGQTRRVRTLDVFSHEINRAVVGAALDKLDYVWMIERRGDVNSRIRSSPAMVGPALAFPSYQSALLVRLVPRLAELSVRPECDRRFAEILPRLVGR